RSNHIMFHNISYAYESLCKRSLDNRFLFFFVKFWRANCRSCSDFPADILKGPAVYLIGETTVASEPLIEDISPSAHIARLFLNPGEFRGRIAIQNRGKFLRRKRIKLFDPNERYISRVLGGFFRKKIVINFS